MILFEYPFLIKSLLLGFFLSILFGVFGVFVFIRKMSFFSDGIAHSAVLGLAIAFILKLNVFYLSILVSILFSSLIFYLEKKSKIHIDALIGLIFVFALSLGLLIMSLKSSYQADLLNFLVGNILTINDSDLVFSILFSIINLIFILSQYKKLILVSIDPVESRLRKINVKLIEFIFYLILGISIILGIKLMGVVLITSFLIVPSITASLISKSFKNFMLMSVLFSLFSTINGFLLAYLFNLPIGPSIVLLSSSIFFVIFLLFKNKNY